jgi:hypothetical protein
MLKDEFNKILNGPLQIRYGYWLQDKNHKHGGYYKWVKTQGEIPNDVPFQKGIAIPSSIFDSEESSINKAGE